MGSTVSIVNETECPLNISLKQATPLYYENKVMPGQTIKRDVGKVWFTLEAKLWNGLNDYQTNRDIVAPISLITLAPFAPIAALAGAGLSRVIQSESPKIGNVFLPNGCEEIALHTVTAWINDYVVREHGIYMGSDRTIRIRGGPSAEFIGEKLHIRSSDAFFISYDGSSEPSGNTDEEGLTKPE